MFAITNQPATLKKLTTRTENHGPDKVPAASVEFGIITNNKILDQFSKSLRSTFFAKGNESRGQQSMDLENLESLTSIAMAEVTQLAWDAQYPGYKVAISAGLEESDPVILIDATVRNFHFEFMDGGSVVVTCTASGTPSGEQVADLYEWQGKIIQLTLTPPLGEEEESPQGDLLESDAEEGEVQGETDVDAPQLVDAVLIDIETTHSTSTHLYTSTATLEDGRKFSHEWAHEPTLEDICDRMVIDNLINAEPSEELIAKLEAEEA